MKMVLDGNALTLAKYIVTKCAKEDHPISNFMLQKILYFVQMKSFSTRDEGAFFDEFEAWKIGPVLPNVYYYFCRCGALPILDTYSVEGPTGLDKLLVDSVVEATYTMNPFDLMEESEVKDGPWNIVYNQRGGKEKKYIKDAIPYEWLHEYARHGKLDIKEETAKAYMKKWYEFWK